MKTHLPQLLAELVRRPSINPMGRTAPDPELFFEHRVSDFLEAFFRDLGVRVESQPVAEHRRNVVAYLESSAAPFTVLFECHQDTVPVEAMTIDPIAAEIRDGKLYGRGACDVKGSLAAMLVAFARLAREKPPGMANVILACTVDEEHTFLGVQRLVKGLKADFAVVAEPTRLNVVKAHKGVVRWLVTTSGRSCHSSAPDQGVNAIYRMGRLLPAIERFADQVRASRTDPLLGPPTLSVGIISGGVSVNTVPDHCRIEVDRRLIPGEDPAAAPREFEAFLRAQPGIDFPFDVSGPWLHCPALGPVGSDEAIARLGRAIDSVVGRHAVTVVPFGTDASTIAEAGIPAVVFGPGDIAQAHTCDEWIDLAEAEAASEVLYRLARG